MNHFSDNHRINSTIYSNSPVLRDANAVFDLLNGSKQAYLALSIVLHKALGFILLIPSAIILRAILMYLKNKINKSIKQDAINRNSSIDTFEDSRAKHERIRIISESFSNIELTTQKDKIPRIIKFALSPLVDIGSTIQSWSMQFQKELDAIDNQNNLQNSDNFEFIPEGDLWKSRNQNYSYRF